MESIFYEVKIKGIRPLLMHNGRLSDPLDPFTKRLKVATKKREKSDEDHEEVARLEFDGGMYHDEEIGPYIPWDNLQAVIERGATKRKLGKQFKAFVGVDPVGGPGAALLYKGPRDPDALWKDRDYVFTKPARLQGKRVVRTRARFQDWWLSFRVEVLDGAVTEEQLKQAISDGGAAEGLGDWRPRYGRFVVESVKEA